MQTDTHPPICRDAISRDAISRDATAEDDRESQGSTEDSLSHREAVGTTEPADLLVADRVQRLLEAIDSLTKIDSESEIPTERLVQVDAIQEHLLEYLEELNQLLQWQVERLVRQRPGSAQAGTTP